MQPSTKMSTYLRRCPPCRRHPPKLASCKSKEAIAYNLKHQVTKQFITLRSTTPWVKGDASYMRQCVCCSPAQAPQGVAGVAVMPLRTVAPVSEDSKEENFNQPQRAEEATAIQTMTD
eukprot:scaffold648010_cov47-Prasinocladus_malaysianus.AAC.1